MKIVNSQFPTPNSQGTQLEAVGRKAPRYSLIAASFIPTVRIECLGSWELEIGN
jgi:hypothetical protein